MPRRRFDALTRVDRRPTTRRCRGLGRAETQRDAGIDMGGIAALRLGLGLRGKREDAGKRRCRDVAKVKAHDPFLHAERHFC
jgi:hypothetical protein